MNLIDSELNENGNDIQEVHEAERTIDKPIPNDKANDTALSEGSEIHLGKDESSPEFETTQEKSNETKVENLHESVDAIPIETTPLPVLEETVTTLIPINESTSLIDSTLSTRVTTPEIESQTESFGIHQQATSHSNHDLSIYFENEPSRARQLRGSNIETDNEVIVHSVHGSESDSSESGIANSSVSSSDSDENQAAEDLSISGSSLNEIINAEPKVESNTNIAIDDTVKAVGEDLVDEIEAVTESTGGITDDVTVVSNMETHTIMKKPGVDDEFVEKLSIPDIGLTDTATEFDPVVNMVLNSPKKELEPSSTLIIDAGNQTLGNTELDQNITKKEELQVSENKISEKPEVVGNGKILDEVKEITEDSNFVDHNTKMTPTHQENKLVISDHSIPELVKSFKSQPENSSTLLNFTSSSAINDNKSLQANILTNDMETSTEALSVEINETPQDLPNNIENGIFKEKNTNLLSFTTETSFADIVIPTNTEMFAERISDGPMNTPLENNHIENITDKVNPADSLQTNETLPTIINDTISNGPNKDLLSVSNSINPTEASFSEEHIESSTQSPPHNRYDSEISEEVQEDQTSKTDNRVSNERDDDRKNPTDDSLPDPKLYDQTIEKSTEISNVHKYDDPSTASIDKNHAGTTTDYARHVDSLQTMRDESSSVVSNEIVAPASIGRSLNEIVAEGLGKPLPTRSVGDEPSSSSYSSEDKTTTVLVLCAAAGGIFIAFSLAIYLISFQRQHGTLDIEMQEQRCGKDNLDDDDDSETRVSLLNQIPTVDSDEHSSD
ncbi:dentin sialophosphoprotein isoform X2 [Eupeodes corollae]|nr:dentin sialophosphoprotein isoform X2 [Eupeodes corollae]XP_055923630.1 dentin sialophosphoprotein isoform X2 [Eupeodes corollae]